VRLSIKAQIRTQSEKNLEKREVRSHNKVRRSARTFRRK